MGGLFASLNTASTALDAFSRALEVDQANVANVSTPGYAAQKASIVPIDLSGDGGAGGGDYVSVTSSGSPFADAVVRAATSQSSNSQTQAAQLSPINQLFDITGSTGILAALDQFSTAFSNLSVTPNDPTAAAAALNAAGNVASAFQSTAASLDTQGAQIASSIQSTVSQINSLAQNIGQLNAQATSSGGSADAGADTNLRSDLEQLSSLVDITVTTGANGAVTVLAGGQLPLVIGDQAYALSANPTAAAGAQVSSSGGGNSPDTFSGQLGALLETQNGAIDELLGSGDNPGTLNTLAAGFAARVNTLLSSGATESGAPGVPIFSYDAVNLSNAARSLTLNPAVTPGQLGIASTGANAEANGIANELAALPSSTAAADQISGLSAEGLFGSIAAFVGQQLSGASAASTADQTALTTAQTNQQQASGVSLDQEAAAITTYQRAYEANAQVVSILNQLTEDVVNMTIPSSG